MGEETFGEVFVGGAIQESLVLSDKQHVPVSAAIYASAKSNTKGNRDCVSALNE